jgi:diguanylate cyclase (GGDEF)-like protein
MPTAPREPAKSRAALQSSSLKIWGGVILAGCLTAVAASTSLALSLSMPLPAWSSAGLGVVAVLAIAGTAWAVARLLRHIEATGPQPASAESAEIGAKRATEGPIADIAPPKEDSARNLLDIERMQDVDPMTGLGNRRWLQTRAAQEFSRVQREGGALSLILLRVDGYDGLDARVGGDAVAGLDLHIADTLRSFVRPYDVVARISASEFGVLLPGATALTVTSIARRLKNAIMAQPPLLLGADMPEISLATAERQAGEMSLDEMLMRSRAAQTVSNADR